MQTSSYINQDMIVKIRLHSQDIFFHASQLDSCSWNMSVYELSCVKISEIDKPNFLGILLVRVWYFILYLIPLLFSFSLSLHFFVPFHYQYNTLFGYTAALAKYCIIHLIFEYTRTP